MQAKMRNDKRKNPTMISYRVLTNDECKALSGHCHILDQNGNIAQVKITSVKTWKTRPDIEVNCKYGLYEFFTVRLDPARTNTELIEIEY